MKPTSIFVCLICVWSAGCSDTKLHDGVRAQNSTNMDRMINCYRLYQSRNEFVGPDSEDKLKSFLRTEEVKSNLELMGITDEIIDEMFTSENDGEPFQIRWSVDFGGPVGPDVPLVFEQSGVEGKRMVGFSHGEHRLPENDEQHAAWLQGDYTPLPNSQNRSGDDVPR